MQLKYIFTYWISNYLLPKGLREFSTPIDLDDKVKIDLVIVGCIAVSTRGEWVVYVSLI